MPRFKSFLGLTARRQKQFLASLLVRKDLKPVLNPLDPRIGDLHTKKQAYAYLEILNRESDAAFSSILNPHPSAEKTEVMFDLFSLGIAFFERAAPKLTPDHFQALALYITGLPTAVKSAILGHVQKQMAVSCWNTLNRLDPFLFLPRQEAMNILEKQQPSYGASLFQIEPKAKYIKAIRLFLEANDDLFPMGTHKARKKLYTILALAEGYRHVIEKETLTPMERKDYVCELLGELYDEMNKDKDQTFNAGMLLSEKEFISGLAERFIFGASPEKLAARFATLTGGLHQAARKFHAGRLPERPSSTKLTSARSPGNGS